MPSPRARLALVAFFVLSLGAAACAGDGDTPAVTGTAAPPTAPTSTLPPDLYTPPSPLPGAAHGDLIRADPVATWWGSPRRAWRVLYRSESSEGEPIAVSGYVLAPASPATEPRPIIAWAHETVGSADQCAPSKTFDTARRDDAAARALADQVLSFLDAGYVVVATDYEGLGTPGPHPYLVGTSEGRGVLDAALAVRQLPGAGAGDDVLVYGVSQGGHAALWAGQLAPEWAPALRLTGVVAAAPFSEVDLLLPAAAALAGGEAYVVLGVYGQAAANPSLDPAGVLDPKVVAAAGIIERACIGEVQTTIRSVAAELGRPVTTVDLRRTPGWQEQLRAIRPGTSTIAAPVLIVQGERDATVPAYTTRVLVSRLCANGTVVRAVYLPDAGHGDVVASADAEVRAWIEGRRAGRLGATTCPTGR